MRIVIFVDESGIVERVVSDSDELEAVVVSYKDTGPVLTPDYSLPSHYVNEETVKMTFAAAVEDESRDEL